jgi:hypothetical protein
MHPVGMGMYLLRRVSRSRLCAARCALAPGAPALAIVAARALATVAARAHAAPRRPGRRRRRGAKTSTPPTRDNATQTPKKGTRRATRFGRGGHQRSREPCFCGCVLCDVETSDVSVGLVGSARCCYCRSSCPFWTLRRRAMERRRAAPARGARSPESSITQGECFRKLQRRTCEHQTHALHTLRLLHFTCQGMRMALAPCPLLLSPPVPVCASRCTSFRVGCKSYRA